MIGIQQKDHRQLSGLILSPNSSPKPEDFCECFIIFEITPDPLPPGHAGIRCESPFELFQFLFNPCESRLHLVDGHGCSSVQKC